MGNSSKRADFNQIGQQFHIDPVIARLIRTDVIGEDKIRVSVRNSTRASFSLADEGYGKSCRDILEKISQKAKVRIIGDYDIDGVTSTYILMKVLRGSSRCGYLYSGQSCRRIWIHAHLIERA